MDLSKYIVDLEDAKAWINNWQNNKDITGDKIKAHLIPFDDVYEIWKRGKENIANFRGYNAIKDDGEFKFLMVGVDEDGNDLVDYNDGFYVYDMTTPCPSVCSANDWWLR